jgi:uroporphyrin-III C-methyltransferase
MTGRVYLVGAGPGDPDLITVKGLRLLQRADVVLYDRLAPAALLSEAPAHAERIDVGKLPQKHRMNQADINQLLIEKARAGLQVVRLKGGDPFVFGRGGEEALACYAAGIPFEVVPGVTSAIAVPAYAGIPVTQRGMAQSVMIFTGHESPDGGTLDYAVLAKVHTLVALMGVKQLDAIVEGLTLAGLDPATPTACIEWGTTAQQRVVSGTLATIVQLATAANLQPPSITVIGRVVALRDQGLDWFTPPG